MILQIFIKSFLQDLFVNVFQDKNFYEQSYMNKFFL